SGMYVRLAFSVAAHLEPDVLLVDEVLSVGDMAFQRRSLAKMNRMKNQANAIVLVSHNMIAVRGICERVILLSQGKIAASGRPDDIVPLYEKVMLESVKPEAVSSEHEEGMGLARINVIKLIDAEGSERSEFET